MMRADSPTTSGAWRELPTAPLVAAYGRRMRRRRQDLGLSLEGLARKMTAASGHRVHFVAATLRAYETNERTPALGTVLFIADCLDTTVTALLGEEPNDRGDDLADAIQGVLAEFAVRRLTEDGLGAPEAVTGRGVRRRDVGRAS